MQQAEGSEAPASVRVADTYAELDPHEIWWRDHQVWLAERGYMLRPRYHPDWRPSWVAQNIEPDDCEDAIPTLYKSLMDATRISDGKIVMLKTVSDETHPYELEINRLFNSEPYASHPRNHCVRVYEILSLPEDPHLHILVMPLLRPFNEPSFKTIGEVVDFFHQVFEADDRDCMDLNIMLDPVSMYPSLFHPQQNLLSIDRKSRAKHYTRTSRPPKYYFIDFGLSGIYDPAKGRTIDRPLLGGDKTVPEFRNDLETPHDVYSTDIYYLGNMIRETFLQVYGGLEFMLPLVNDMVQDDPTKRPKIDEVVKRFAEIRRSLSWWKLRSRLAEQNESGLYKAYQATKHVFRTMGYVATFRSAVPSPSK
ncbi:hypothetical protein NM688_g4866 [Phlebia brevispora]|uniref:Uncharacterized protein n=1 Tax=Phlebia brevispora TaxID=194682 RepID=A0ACC1T1G3_9APHY|nr:hypothetical protein NM688_g4866 [Phlebia brevispora]